MKEPYVLVNGLAQAETPKAFCIKNPETVMDGAVHKFTGDLWIPKSVILEDSHDVIEEAARNDSVEIFVAKWWMEENG